MLVFGYKILPSLNLNFTANKTINDLLCYQLFAFSIAVIVLLISVSLSPSSKALLSLGDLGQIAQKEKWLGINGTSTWKKEAFQLLIFISLATGIFMVLSIKNATGQFHLKLSHIPVILLIAITNSFSEEIIYRFCLLGNLSGSMPKIWILVLSAICFGVPHLAGTPSGIVGIIMAGLLGYILAKASYETQGLGIAWGIHCVQDIIIFTALFNDI